MAITFISKGTTHLYSEPWKCSLAVAKTYSFLAHLPGASWFGRCRPTCEGGCQKGMGSWSLVASKPRSEVFLPQGCCVNGMESKFSFFPFLAFRAALRTQWKVLPYCCTLAATPGVPMETQNSHFPTVLTPSTRLSSVHMHTPKSLAPCPWGRGTAQNQPPRGGGWRTTACLGAASPNLLFDTIQDFASAKFEIKVSTHLTNPTAVRIPIIVHYSSNTFSASWSLRLEEKMGVETVAAGEGACQGGAPSRTPGPLHPRPKRKLKPPFFLL